MSHLKIKQNFSTLDIFWYSSPAENLYLVWNWAAATVAAKNQDFRPSSCRFKFLWCFQGIDGSNDEFEKLFFSILASVSVSSHTSAVVITWTPCDLQVISRNMPLKLFAFKLLLQLCTNFHSTSMCVCVDGLNIKSLVRAPGGAESRSQSSNLMRDSPLWQLLPSSLSSACRNGAGYVDGGGCEVGIPLWGFGHGGAPTRDDRGKTTVSTPIWVTAS